MLTPQEVSSRAFTKAVLGGYNMAAVDEFLDVLTADYSSLYKENAALKAKMKVLVEKVEEYRATEESMRATLLTAQRMAESIVKEAEAKRDELLAQAASDVQDQGRRCQLELEEAELRLRRGQQEMARFINTSREWLIRELEFLDQLPQTPVSLAPPAAEPAVQAEEIGEKVIAAFAAAPEAADAPAKAAAEAAESPSAEEDAGKEAAPAEDGCPESDPLAEEPPLDETRRINLDELKFGRNYVSD